jgi:predicted enzyme related to lactoylglutathione lyase
MENTIVWADIPVTDLDRAMEFYGAVLQRTFIKAEGMEGIAMEAPSEEPAEGLQHQQYPVSFDLAVVQDQGSRPSTDGCTVYLNSSGDPQAMMDRAVAAGGELIMPVTDMGEMIGFIGFFKDTEGNKIGVHAPPKMG